MPNDRFGEPIEPQPEEDILTNLVDKPLQTPEYQAWWKSWLDYCRSLLEQSQKTERHWE